jgi:hypothetical protein
MEAECIDEQRMISRPKMEKAQRNGWASYLQCGK